MRLLGNILWHIPFLGFLNALFAFCLGLVLTALVVTAPIGLGLIQFSKFLLLPYSYDMVKDTEVIENKNPLWDKYSFIIMVIYFPLGLCIALCMLMQTIFLACTIVGIPVAIPLAKSLGTYLNPVGKVCISTDMAQAINLEKAKAELNAKRQKSADKSSL